MCSLRLFSIFSNQITGISSFAKNIGLIVVLNLIIKPVGLIVEALVQRNLGNEKYGLYAALYSLGYLLYAVADLGINQYLTKVIASEPDKAKAIAPKLFGLKLVLAVIYPFLMVGLGWLLDYQSEALLLLAVLSFGHAMIQINLFYRGSFQGYQLFKIDAFASNIDKILFIGAMAVFLFIGSQSLDLFVYSRVGAIVLTFVVLIFIGISYKASFKPIIRLGETKNILKASLPFALITILYSVNEKIDQVMVERLAENAKEAGIYSGAYRWVDAVMQYLWIVLPMFFAKFAHHESTQELKQRLLGTGTVITALPVLLIVMFVQFHGSITFSMFDNFEAWERERMTRSFEVLSWALACHGIFAILSTYLTSNGHTKIVNQALAASIILNVSLNAVFIPEYGAYAAAGATVVSTLFLCIAYVIFIIAKTPMTIPLANWIKLTGLAGLMYGGFFTCDIWGWSPILALIAVGIVSLGYTIVTKLLTLQQLKSI